MSRWTRRTQEEKNAILQKIERQKQAKQKYPERLHLDNPKLVKEIYLKNEIPTYCMKDGWTWSNKYILTEETTLFGKQLMIKGHCKDCGRPIERMVLRTVDELLLFPLAVANLTQQGRLIDRRHKNKGD